MKKLAASCGRKVLVVREKMQSQGHKADLVKRYHKKECHSNISIYNLVVCLISVSGHMWSTGVARSTSIRAQRIFLDENLGGTGIETIIIIIIIIIIIRNMKYNSTIASDVLQCNIVNKCYNVTLVYNMSCNMPHSKTAINHAPSNMGGTSRMTQNF